ncbi:hypothetical protein AX16_001556 [Volvariella volvacea WC 439]|nr:hypothetical protein AX16_001556 [Volvariella volvacea WC 439]
MSSIPVRRAGKGTHHATVLKHSENIIARPSSLSSRSSKSTNYATSLAEVTSRVTAPTAASLAKCVNTKPDDVPIKKKREVLVEVTKLVANKKNVGLAKVSGILKGNLKVKGKEKEVEVAEGAPLTRAEMRAQRPRSLIVTGKERVQALEKFVISRPLIQDKGILLPASKTTTSTTEVIRPSLRQRVESSNSSSSKRPVSSADVVEIERVFKKPCREYCPEPPRQVKVFEPVFTRPTPEGESEADIAKVAEQLECDIKTQDTQDTSEEIWDALEADDPDELMVAEYAKDIYKYMKEREIKTLPNPNLMELQTDIDWDQRAAAVEWIINLHRHYQFVQETIFLFTNVLDRFLSRRRVSASKFQLAAMACFLIACKYEEMFAPSVPEVVEFSRGAFGADDLLKAEKYVLKTIGWDLSYPSPLGWLRRISKADDFEARPRTVAKFLIEIGCVEWRLVGTPPSLLAAAAMWLARLVVGHTEWTPKLRYYSTYEEEELIPIANVMLNFIAQPSAPELFPVIFRKYASKSFYKCSLVLRAWAQERWPDDYDIDLEYHLSELKEDLIRERELEKLKKECEDEVF